MAAQRTYVLVHGAWHGGWATGPPLLRAAGHRVFTPTLTGQDMMLDMPDALAKLLLV